MRRKREHDGLHDVKVAAAAVLTLLAILVVSELTDYDPPETPAPTNPPVSGAPDMSDRREVAQLSASRSDLRVAPSPSAPERGGAHQDTSGDGEEAGKLRQAPVVVGQPWAALAECESGGDWSIDTGNGYYGGLQFSLTSWQGVGGSGYPHEASVAEQIKRAKILQASQGWGAWPTCSAIVGLP